MPPTHTVTNQSQEFHDHDLYAADPLLDRALAPVISENDRRRLHRLGAIAGSAEFLRHGFDANRYEPELRTHDRFGYRIDEVEFHPAWHALLDNAVSAGLTSLPYEDGAPDNGHLVRAAGSFLTSQVEQGHGCPVAMTYAVMPVLRHRPDIESAWRPLLTSRVYDPASAPRTAKRGALMGMGMTEKQGGSDVRANTTSATPTERSDGAFTLTGHKWFLSAPMCDAFLVLAQAPSGLSCFFVPRWTADGERNPIRIQRLKDKLGNRSNASSEIEFDGTEAHLVGEQGRGVATIIDMVNATRLDCVIGSAATMRQAMTQALWHTAHRAAFGHRLVEQPLMRNVLADLELDVQAATALMIRTADAFDRAEGSEHEALVKRLLTPVAKFWVTKQCTPVAREAMECLGGAGYVEETILPRLFRESPVNAIWEGTGNVIALDTLRALRRAPEALDALLDLARASRFAAVGARAEQLGRGVPIEHAELLARSFVDDLATVTAAALLERYAEPAVAEAFVATRIDTTARRLHGCLPASIDHDAILDPAIERLLHS